MANMVTNVYVTFHSNQLRIATAVKNFRQYDSSNKNENVFDAGIYRCCNQNEAFGSVR